MNEIKPANLIANAVRRERERSRLSLSALADKSGLAKSTLSQLEAGKGNPSIETLWAIATALEVPFSFLFENTMASSTLIRATEGAKLSADASNFDATLLSKCATATRRDIYRIDLRSGSIRKSSPHPHSTIEHAIVCRGKVRIGPTDNLQELNTGDYFQYSANGSHTYEALSKTAVLILIMQTAQ